LPRLKCTYREFVEIIEAQGFEPYRHGATSHRRCKGMVAGELRFVDVTPHNWNDDIPSGTLQSMIRQSGLSKRLFRK
jgi:predicted RNA binding protein YcfA (HicA-like mRNA interferase family)